MNIRLTGRHVELNDSLRNYIEDKIGKLSRFYDRIHEVEVILDHAGEQHAVEIIVRAGHKQTFVASETGPDPLAVIDIILDKLERQLNKHKEKNRNHKGGMAADGNTA